MLLPDSQIQELLRLSGLIDQKTMQDVIASAANARIPLQEAVIEKNVIPDDKLGQLIANYIKYPFVVLSKNNISEEVYKIVPERLARKHRVIAFAKDSYGVKLAMADPVHIRIADSIAKKTQQKVTVYMATERNIENVLQMYKRNLQATFDDLLQEEITRSGTTMDDAPIIKIVDLLISYAYREKSSDIHIEPEEKNSLVRFRTRWNIA